ncbi:hypothetical protein [Paenibacillus campi]|uniref:hypothetical protein n=1 Tax=Paenibacillus campi TaxID=3106031 RepID=UPI002AFE78F7|nr:hypothetical protein [Paenibacillus sp. SGZ-1009]
MHYCEKRIKPVTQLVHAEAPGTSVSVEGAQSVSIAELRQLSAFVHHYSERTRHYAGQIEQLRQRSNQLRAEAAQLLHLQPCNEWNAR